MRRSPIGGRTKRAAKESTAAPGWYCVAGQQLFVWEGEQWFAVADVPDPSAAGIGRSGGYDRSSKPGILWFWNGEKWIVPGQDGDPVADAAKALRIATGAWIALGVTIGLIILTALIGESMDWLICPGDDCSADGLQGDDLISALVVGSIVGLIYTFVEAAHRRKAARDHPRPPGPWAWTQGLH